MSEERSSITDWAQKLLQIKLIHTPDSIGGDLDDDALTAVAATA